MRNLYVAFLSIKDKNYVYHSEKYPEFKTISLFRQNEFKGMNLVGENLIEIVNNTDGFADGKLCDYFSTNKDEVCILKEMVQDSYQLLQMLDISKIDKSYYSFANCPIMLEKADEFGYTDNNKKLKFSFSYTTPTDFTGDTFIMQVYEVHTLHETLAVEYMKYNELLHANKTNKILHCYICGKLFFGKRSDRKYCSKLCSDKSFKLIKENDEYYKKYRNKCTNMNKDNICYNEWQEFARKEYNKTQKVGYEKTPNDFANILNKKRVELERK